MKDGYYLKCSCKKCGGHIEFPANGEGATVNCPHCNQPTKLTLDEPPAKPLARGIPMPGILAGVGLLLAAAGVAAFFFLHGRNHAAAVIAPPGKVVTAPTNQSPPAATEKPATAPETKPGPKRPKSASDLKVGEVKLEKTKGSSLVYAIGTVTNNSDYQRFGVKVELDVFNNNETKISTTSDYISILEPRREWSFRALIRGPGAASARISTVKEEE